MDLFTNLVIGTLINSYRFLNAKIDTILHNSKDICKDVESLLADYNRTEHCKISSFFTKT